MTELKTLKDFEGMIKNVESHRLYETLKQEAIKWVKVLREKGMTQSNERFLEDEGRKQWIKIFRVSHILWIKYFFNITEEDLK